MAPSQAPISRSTARPPAECTLRSSPLTRLGLPRLVGLFGEEEVVALGIASRETAVTAALVMLVRRMISNVLGSICRAEAKRLPHPLHIKDSSGDLP